MTDKICTGCKKKKPATSDYFYTRLNKNKTIYLAPLCKSCCIEKEKKRIKNMTSCMRQHLRKKYYITRNKTRKLLRRKERALELNIKYETYVFYLNQRKITLKNKRQLNKLLKRLNMFKPKLIKKDLKYYKERYQISDSDWLELKKDNAEETTLIYRIRYKHDTEFNLKERLRNQLTKQRKKYPNLDYAIRSSVVKNQNTKYLDILGYTKEELKNHLEKQFTNDMSWKDFRSGKIHIDHIKPQSLFNLKDINDIKECWSLDNLQPLWAKDNIRKSNKYNGE